MSDQPQSNFEQWCIVELFGHQVTAGRVTEQTIGGCAFIRVDVPAYGNSPPVTHFYGHGAIYCMTPVDQETVLRIVQFHEPHPVNIYIPPLQLPSPNEQDRPRGFNDLLEPADYEY
jgi:hypothetical protein